MAIIDTRMVEKLEADVRKLKAEKEKVEQKTKECFNEQIDILSKIKELKVVRESEIAKNLSIEQEIKEKQEKLSEVLGNIEREARHLIEITQAQDAISSAFEAREKRLDEGNSLLSKGINKLNEDRKKLEVSRINALKEREALDNDKKAVLAQMGSLNETKNKYLRDSEELSKKKDELNNLIKQQKEYNDTLIKNINEAESLKKEFEGKISVVESKEDKLVKEIASIKVKTDETEKLREVLEKENRGNERVKQELDNYKTTLEIENLRIKKIIRDNNLQGKLDEMQKNI